MNFRLLIILIFSVNCAKQKTHRVNRTVVVNETKKILEDHQENLAVNFKNTTSPSVKITDVVKIKIKKPIVQKNKHIAKMIPPYLVEQWAGNISERLFENEEHVVRREELTKSFSDIKIEVRNGSKIVEKMATSLKRLLVRRVEAAERIMKRAEKLAEERVVPPPDYAFDYSVDLDKVKPMLTTESEWELPLNCRSLHKVKLRSSDHFDAQVSLETTSVHVAVEVFDCDPRVVKDLYWTENLLSAFKENYALDASTDFQYFCSAKGFLRHYPAALWSSMFKLELDTDDVYDCRLRPWYVSATGAPRDVLILLDASGSMSNSSNKIVAEQFTLALLNALTDDDQVNVLRFNIVVESPISCFNDKLVSANHVNSAAMMSAIKLYKVKNETKMERVLEYAVNLLENQRVNPDTPTSCQQAIVLLTDSMYDNYTDLMKRLDSEGRIRLFVMWLHDRYGLRDDTRQYGQWISCVRDGYFAELVTDSDVTEQVMRILRILERPLVVQRERRLRVFSDVYAHVEDPRRSEYYWRQKENAEQAYRYQELRRNKERLLRNTTLYDDYMNQQSLETAGQYYEGADINYRFQITVSVPVFDHTTLENITIRLDAEKEKYSTRTYPVNRLLGVAGIDIPVDHLKLILPYHQLGPGGSLFLVDHRGNIVLHNNIKPIFDGDILKPGYRTVDFLDLEQSAVEHFPRHYPREWVEFREALIVDKPSGNKTLYAKYIFEEGMRTNLELREYHWRRVLDHYTAVVVLPKYNRRHAVPEVSFTKELADTCYKALSGTDFSVQPDWLYCRHVEPYFDTREAEVLHFVLRRKDESDFQMEKLNHYFSPIPPALLDKTYQCDEELMARFCKEAIASEQWAREHEMPGTDRDCSSCQLGSTTAFIATESGLTRWQQYHATSSHADPPEGLAWPRATAEPWYVRAAAAPGMLVVHLPVAPISRRRNTDTPPPIVGTRDKWLTAARTFGQPNKGIIGVAGYHFHPEHLEDLLDAITNFHCPDEEACDPRCDDQDWSCVLIDDGGWIVARYINRTDNTKEEFPQEHLANLYPAAMAALLNASIFKLHWVNDYQGVCFPPEDEKLESAAPTLPSLLRSLWHSINLCIRLSREIVTVFTLLTSGGLVSGDTEFEKEKRRNKIRRDYEREKFETLYDSRVLINRTKFAACDRSRALYELQRTPYALNLLKRPPHPCTWPLVGAVVPKTNLVLIAVYKLCPYEGRPVPDPYVNEPVKISEEDHKRTSSAGRLACWRNRVTLRTRPPHSQCFPHNYTEEEGYRQCGPWIPDEEVEDDANQKHFVNRLLLLSVLLSFYNSILV